ncbi:hypothetical protein LMTR13_26130 [Bradyrhizobium icense]|uniref:Uncharacterized protein n=1 Tax=Bradyrhizobium icense TaxID=1274631 RepID=A0A1B1UK79_9BRAD|nr:hypothetical protein LMTR13_26130 [Bradyrhizobium icense]
MAGRRIFADGPRLRTGAVFMRRDFLGTPILICAILTWTTCYNRKSGASLRSRLQMVQKFRSMDIGAIDMAILAELSTDTRISHIRVSTRTALSRTAIARGVDRVCTAFRHQPAVARDTCAMRGRHLTLTRSHKR